jgi:hypothetical protein
MIKYTVECSSPAFLIPKEVLLPVSVLSQPSESEDLNLERKSIQNLKHNLQVTFRPHDGGEYSGKLFLSSAFDVRVYELRGVAQTPNIFAELEMVTTARKPLTQQIPIFNNTSVDWFLVASIKPTNEDAGKTGADCVFHGIGELSVPPQQTVQFSLIFEPRIICDATAVLKIQNMTVASSRKTGQLNLSLAKAWEEMTVCSKITFICFCSIICMALLRITLQKRPFMLIVSLE